MRIRLPTYRRTQASQEEHGAGTIGDGRIVPPLHQAHVGMTCRAQPDWGISKKPMWFREFFAGTMPQTGYAMGGHRENCVHPLRKDASRPWDVNGLGQQRRDLEQAAADAGVRDLEDRRRLVLIHREDAPGILHAGLVPPYGAGNAHWVHVLLSMFLCCLPFTRAAAVRPSVFHH